MGDDVPYLRENLINLVALDMLYFSWNAIPISKIWLNSLAISKNTLVLRWTVRIKAVRYSVLFKLGWVLAGLSQFSWLARSYDHEIDSFCYYDFRTGSTFYLLARKHYLCFIHLLSNVSQARKGLLSTNMNNLRIHIHMKNLTNGLLFHRSLRRLCHTIMCQHRIPPTAAVRFTIARLML